MSKVQPADVAGDADMDCVLMLDIVRQQVAGIRLEQPLIQRLRGCGRMGPGQRKRLVNPNADPRVSARKCLGTRRLRTVAPPR